MVLSGIFIIKTSFLESISAISSDNKITSIDLIVTISALRVIFIAVGFLFISYPLISLKIRNIASKILLRHDTKDNMKKIQLPPASFVIFLFLLLLVYMGVVFFSHFHYISAQRQMHDPSKTALISDAVKTGQYFYKMLTTTPFITEPERNEIDLPVYNLYLDKDLLDKLNSDLPESGEEYADGSIVINNITYNSKLRYRGDTFYHWYFPKKSWRVKLKGNQLINFSNMFNLMNPKLDSHIQEMLAYHIAEKAGLIVPRTFPAAVFLNDEYMGVYYYSDQIDESFLRSISKVPGDIYYGEIYSVKDKMGILFDSAENWDIMATADNNETRAFQNMVFFIGLINKSNDEFYSLFKRYLGDEYLRFYALNLLLDEFRVDNYHNHKLYFDPTSGRFEPIVWDLMPFMNRSLQLNNDDSNALFSKINLIPPLVERRNSVIWELMDEIPEEQIFEYIDNSSRRMDYEMKHDKLKDAYDAPWILTYDDWKTSLDDLKIAVHDRYSFLRERLDNATVVLNVVNSSILVMDVSGESGAIIEQIMLEKSPGPLCYSLFRDMNFDGSAQQAEKIAENCSSSIDFGSEKLYPGKNDTLRYRYILKTTEDGGNIGVISINDTLIYNSVTGRRINPAINILSLEEQLPKILSSSSVHPWLLPKGTPKKIILEGGMSLTEDIIMNYGDLLVIEPGTTIKLAPGVSIISYGKIIAEGTQDMPIRFIPLDEDRPWGAVALQGNGADGSSFSYCNFEKGSGAKYELVHYTGMLSAYNADIRIDHCSFDSNQIEDDTFNSKYANTTITDSEFTNAFGDGIDFDISTGLIENTKFYNIVGDAIDLMTSTPLIRDNFIEKAGDKGISIGEQSAPIIINNTIISSNMGMAIKDLSNPLIINNTLQNNEIGIAAYEKNWRYGGGGRGIIITSDICQNKRPLLLQDLSVVDITHNGIDLRCTVDECSIDCGADSIY